MFLWYVVLAADKETCAVILNRKDYQNKVNNMINEGIADRKYIETVDNTHKDLKHFQDFLYCNLYKNEQNENMRRKSSRPGTFLLRLKLIALTLSIIYLKIKLNCVQL